VRHVNKTKPALVLSFWWFDFALCLGAPLGKKNKTKQKEVGQRLFGSQKVIFLGGTFD